MNMYRRSQKELRQDFQRTVGDMAEHRPRENAKKFFEHKPYTKDMKEEKKWKTMNIEGE